MPWLSTRGQVLILGLLAIGLLIAPIWIGIVPINEQTYTYDRHEVGTNESALSYADPESVPPRTPISESVDCAGWGGDIRACQFESHLLEAGAIPTDMYSTNPNGSPNFAPFSENYYRYVQLDGQVYEPSYTVNESVQREDGWYRIDMTLEPKDPDAVLGWISLTSDDQTIADPVTDAAMTGQSTAHTSVAVPETPIEVDGSYYRVVEDSDVSDPHWTEPIAESAIRVGGPVGGVLILYVLSRRIGLTVTLTGSDRP